MAEKRTIVLVCDLCEREAGDAVGVETRTIVVDGVGAEAEACDGCWEQLMVSFSVFATRGRRLPPRTPKLRGAKSIPGSPWRFTSHALIRCGERNLDPVEIVEAIDDPTIVRPGRASDQEIRERGTLKAVVVPERGIVVTVARRGEDDESDLASAI